MNSPLTSAILYLVALLSSGCLSAPATEVPLPSIDIADPESRNNSVVIMLPGRGDRADAFIREGFERAGRSWGFDTIAVDAHFGYYRQRSLLPRLHEDIVMPAHAAGYENVWLLGISMGGFGSLLYASEHPDQVDGLILLAPFLGDQDAIGRIIANGGLKNLSSGSTGMEDYEVAVWTWLRETTSQARPKPIVLGYGLSDGMAPGYKALTDVIEPSSVYTLEGGHKWTTWGPLWEKIAADLKL
jgi:pimeloyl-ACP methyl ester carboxylesterase